MTTPRSGILAAGNFIVDYVKIVDHYPQQDMLASILSESQANGGGPYNVLKDLAAMQADFPLAACGLVGDDANGRWIRRDCEEHGIDTSQLHSTALGSTSYTDAMTVKSTGRRTFFHQRGANALFDVAHCDCTQTNAKILHLGYLMLLDHMDSFASDGQTHASRLLALAQQAGLETSVDMVSTENPQFREIALSALPFTDHLIINEIEASRVLSRTVKADDFDALLSAAQEILHLGVTQSVTIHVEHGAAACTRAGTTHIQPSLDLPPGYSQGATGAGDAFAAGLLYGLHEHMPLPDRLRLAVCTAAASLSHPTPSGGMKPVADCLALAEQFPFRF
ncbi:sugar/nucleoside kinase (ribokinase family) [Prosthecobacter fusiformis]|uniref:Sugar/nucleoside kinase (Ribokinase family) n=1 Tax=Prosthecobacter fusiformis TaxID=48464 RepID=A0A4V3FI62_9BACT|nr:carbohydrate kinase family protein [Prosthecobacter fusiformis]TDU81173.1 sugar/nucleoside kinase (ribokinase family) [Prosthecobacter fusiformis]